MFRKIAIATLLLLVAPFFGATQATAAVLPSKGPENAVGLIIKYRAGVSPIAPNGEATGSNFAGVGLADIHAIGDDFFAARFDSPTSDSEAQQLAANARRDPRVLSVYVDHDFRITSQSLRDAANYQLGIALGTLIKPASAPLSVKVIDALSSTAPNSPRVKLSWVAPRSLFGAKISGYQIWRSINGAAFTLANTLSRPTPTYSYQSLGLQAGRVTRFYVRPITKLGTAIKIGTRSAIVSITPTAKPVSPQIVTYSDSYLTTPTWNALSLAERGGLPVTYHVTASAPNLPNLTCSSTATSCQISNFNADANYKLSIVATNTRGSSASTSVIRAKDPYFYEQWYLWGTFGINAPAAWSQLPTGYGSDVVVAVIDSGFTPHPDLDPQVVPGYDFVSLNVGTNDSDGWDADASDPGSYSSDPSSTTTWHGTHVAGLIGAANNSIGLTGAAAGVKLQSVRALGVTGGQESDLFAAVTWASGGTVQGVPDNPTPAKVINISMGTTSPTPCGSSLVNAFAAAKSRGVTIVTAAGNGDAFGNPMPAIDSYPGNCYGSINVAATSASGDIAYYSNNGLGVDIAAPGGDDHSPENTESDAHGMMLSTYNSGTRTPGQATYAFDEGTSMAAPLVSATVALMYAKKPTITVDEVWSFLSKGVKAFKSGSTCALTVGKSNQLCGVGIVDAGKTLALVK